MIEIENLTKSYGNKTVINNLSLSVKEGMLFGLLGLNGAGKTTLISILNALTPFQKGSIKVDRLNVTSNAKKVRAISSMVPQSLAFYENLSVKENLNFFASLNGCSTRQKERSISICRLSTLLHEKSAVLSGGQKRRLNIAIGLLNNPKVLYFDEPTVGIDPESRNEIIQMIANLRDEKKTIVYTTHYMNEIETMCDEVAIIDQGEVLCCDTLENLLKEQHGEQVVFETQNMTKQKSEMLKKEVKGIGLFGDVVILNSTEPRQIAVLCLALERNGLTIKEIRKGKKSLEKLFIQLTSQRQRHD